MALNALLNLPVLSSITSQASSSVSKQATLATTVGCFGAQPFSARIRLKCSTSAWYSSHFFEFVNSMPRPAFAAISSVSGEIQATRIESSSCCGLRGRGRIVVSGIV